ncbi:penicillin-binding protein 1C [Pelistega sp. NLN82]|uniref:peptidoglycan glycosyltransferase n=1 Tax=Pelistega ratti TaxID=2652177 RepID=A0A6L9Y4N8_9BURK|nr:penicillin-binding protein 1C [Pelistega ratti]NEN74748.1 penicillin-binding protein 1C [Pelistega ratti]
MKKIIKLLLVFTIFFCVLILGLYIWAWGQVVPSYEQVVRQTQSSSIQIVDRRGEPLIAIRDDFQQRKVPWTKLEAYSPTLHQMVLQSEDKRFYQHHGVDWFAWLGAVKDKLFSSTSRGASTITMQLVGILLPELQRQGKQRSYWQKIQQIAYAIRLEQTWSKEQILEAYLNLVPLRGEVVGMASGAKAFFQKYSYALNQKESALLVAMLKAPNAKINTLVNRTCLLIRPNSCDYLDVFVNNAVSYLHGTFVDEAKEGSHFARAFLKHYLSSIHTTDKTLKSTIDKQLQQFVSERIRTRLMDLFQEQISDAAVVVLDNATGEILAYVGSSGSLSSAQEVDHAQALRQAGSTLKPFLYAQAFDKKYLTAASLLNDSALSIAVDTGLYIPQNYDKGFKGWVSIRKALASSLNIPAVQTLTMLGAESFRNTLVRLGLPLSEEGDFYGYSLALGSADITLLSLTNAYRSLANQGYYTPIKWLSDREENRRITKRVGDNSSAVEVVQDTQGEQVFSPQSAWIIQSILSDRQARALTFGLDSALSTPFDTAVKTGTSKDMRDNWTVGWSSRYTVGVWVGNSAGHSMRNISGVSGAAPIWHDVMQYLHQETPSVFVPMPKGVVVEQIEYKPAIEPSRKEYFIEGTQQQSIRLVSSIAASQEGVGMISMPTDGTIIALDPDIPAENQQLRLEARMVNQQLSKQIQWVLNGKAVSQSNPAYIPLQAGSFKLELLSLSGEKLDEVHFQVRGIR